jgi:hypothetical protein
VSGLAEHCEKDGQIRSQLVAVGNELPDSSTQAIQIVRCDCQFIFYSSVENSPRVLDSRLATSLTMLRTVSASYQSFCSCSTLTRSFVASSGTCRGGMQQSHAARRTAAYYVFPWRSGSMTGHRCLPQDGFAQWVGRSPHPSLVCCSWSHCSLRMVVCSSVRYLGYLHPRQ